MAVKRSVKRVSPESSLEAAMAAFGQFDLDLAVVHLSAAVRGFTTAGNIRQAAMACSRLGEVYGNFLGNKVAARPWFLRAVRMLEDEEPCVEQGWVAVAPMGCDIDDPAELRARSELALARARQFGDGMLEMKALADGGLAHVQAGRLAEGMTMMDEAMALICGSGDDTELTDVHVMSVCSFYTACWYTADYGRFEAWTPLLRQRGLIGGEGQAAVLRSHCDSVQGILLSHQGRWHEAEAVLERALADIERAMPMMVWHPPIALADLRIRQGRLAEAEALLLGREDHIQALLPTARLHLVRGDHALAIAGARRGLRLLGDDRVRAAALLGVIVEAELGRGDVAAAAEASEELDDRVAGAGLVALTAEADRLRAQVHRAQGDARGAVAIGEAALSEIEGNDLPLLKALLHLDLARSHEARGDVPAAVIEGRAAGAALARIDVVLSADDDALLRRLGVDSAPAPPRAGCRVATMQRAGVWWTVGCGDTNVRLRDTKGLGYLAELVAHPGAERHAIDLVDVVEGVPASDTGLDRRRWGHAGELLDSAARGAYRRRVAELRDEVEDALAVEDDDRAAKLQTELDSLVGELARAFGLGGSDRKASSVAEKARLNVTRALRAAITKVAEALPEAGAVLDRRVRTGLFCAYEPHSDDEILWSVQS